MRCQRIQPHLLALIEGELQQKKRDKVAMHVAACPACASAMRSLRRTLRVVQTIDVPEPSPAFWQEFGTALHQRIRREEAAQQGLAAGRSGNLPLAQTGAGRSGGEPHPGVLLPFLGGHPGQQRIPRMVLLGAMQRAWPLISIS